MSSNKEIYLIFRAKIFDVLDADAVQKMIASKEGYFLEVAVEKEDNVFPMIPSGASVSDIRLS